MPADGAAFVASKIDAIAANPDENDGLFDHVAPPVPPEGTPHEFVEGLPIGGGFQSRKKARATGSDYCLGRVRIWRAQLFSSAWNDVEYPSCRTTFGNLASKADRV
jgi:phospholipase C